MRSFILRSGFVFGERSHFGVVANVPAVGNSLGSSIIGNGTARREIDLEAELSQPVELVQQRATAEAQRLGSFCAVEIVFAQGEEDGFAFEVFQPAGLKGQSFRGLRRTQLDRKSTRLNSSH